MAAKRVIKQVGKRGESGQSLLEFCLLLPVLLGLVTILYRANSAIQISIVNQQYARAQALYLTFNSPIYPQNRIRQNSLTSAGFNQMVIGISDEEVKDQGEPVVTVQRVARTGAGASENSKEEPELRARVRVRTNVSLCTQQNVLANGAPILGLGGQGNSVPQGVYALNEGSTFKICGSPL